ncbi:MAG: N-acetyltransferase [Gammaproteobacteria bacterium]|nr:N-acetyltransferase [Gammaproteobacteria bacterium]MCY4339621.1 N-acetyltransferase [Gammaproteobacteria bacterium]
MTDGRSKSFAGGNNSIRVVAVNNRRRLAEFIRLPWHLYAQDPCWVPPLQLERRLHLSSFNPYFAHARWQGWVAWQADRPVGRISAQVDDLHRRHYDVKSGHFGFLECTNSPDVMRALVATSERWLTQQQTEVITGPFNFSINQECGLLVDGFDTPPAMMMPHNPPWYAALLEQQGYRAAKELYAYWVKPDFTIPKVMQNLVNRFGGAVRLRVLDRSRFKQELETLREIFNDAWSHNWGFVPFTRQEFAELGTSLRLFVPDDFIRIAEYQGEPVAFIAGLPNLHEVTQGLNGRLFPTGLLKIIHALRNRRIRSGRIPLMGVRRKLQQTPLGIALALLVINDLRQPVIERGITGVEMSWILEDNKGMRSILERIGSRLYKTYRIYEKRMTAH